MHVLVTGGTGFVGRALSLRLQRDGHVVHALVRDPLQAASLLGPDVALVATAAGPGALRDALSRCDAVVNLAGEPVLPGRWTERRREVLTESRVGVTRALVAALREVPERPRVLVSASAVGYYGASQQSTVDETSPPGRGFLAELCQAWEAEATAATALGVRVVLPRLGIVLGPGGGALRHMLTPFRLGLGGPLGSGRQSMPWIHLEDAVEALVVALTNEAWTGPVNLTASHPASNEEFTRVLASRLGVRALFRAPAPLVRLALGEAASVLLTGPEVDPRRLREFGFTPRHATPEAALDDLLGPATGPTFEPCSALPEAEYLRERPPRCTLRSSVRLAAPLAKSFPFFSRVENLGALTPRQLGFLTDPESRPVEAGAEFVHHVRVGPARLRWRTRILDFEDGRGFTDVQLEGPYRSWFHQHRFHEQGGGTVVEDVVHHAVPLGPLGDVVHALVVRHQLDDVFRFRRLGLLLRFGRHDSNH